MVSDYEISNYPKSPVCSCGTQGTWMSEDESDEEDCWRCTSCGKYLTDPNDTWDDEEDDDVQ